ncbi:MAG: hypothetical protein FWC18_02560 [Cystobacterineae bacterium]|nr:hypothetical protein [Cystobacterineae bacterium]
MQQLYGQLPPQVDRLILDVDGVLVDPSSSYYAVGRRLLAREGGVLPEEDIAAFKWAGGFNDDWELARAALGLHRYRQRSGDKRPLSALLATNAGLPGVLQLVGGDDPGDLSAECERLYAQIAHEELPLLEAPLLQQVAAHLPLYACTGRTREQTMAAFASFGVAPKAFVSCETARKPNPQALLPLLEGSRHPLFVGDTWDDCLTAINAQPLTSAQLSFFWCLPPLAPPHPTPPHACNTPHPCADTPPPHVEWAVQQRLQRGGQGATLGVGALLRALLLYPPCSSSTPSASSTPSTSPPPGAPL